MRRIFLWLGASLALALGGCEEAGVDPVGTYEWRGFNCGGTLELRPNGSYRSVDSVTYCLGGITSSRETRGRWAVSGSRLELFQPKGPRLSYSVRVEGKGDKARKILHNPERLYLFREVTEQERISREENYAALKRAWEEAAKERQTQERPRK